MITLDMIDDVINKLKENTRECINISVEPCNTLLVSTSKFGGIPYIPNDAGIPTDSTGTQLSLLAQINCSELPENKYYPTSGILQFWIGRDANLGLDDKKSYRVTYFDKIDESITSEDVLATYSIPNKDHTSPFKPESSSFKLQFSTGYSFITANDYQFEEKVLALINELYPDEQISDLYTDLEKESYIKLYSSFKNNSHSLGSYPSFIQWDPRSPEDNYNFTLLQVDSELNPESDAPEILWGDSGIANFFISVDDLKNLNFDNILFNWDCF